MSLNDGGPAFPSQGRTQGDMPAEPMDKGISARDYFALGALPGVMLTQAVAAANGLPVPFDKAEEETAKAANAIADAMLAERDR